MPEKLKEILARIRDWWNRYTSRQKTIIVSIAAVVILTFAILIYVLTRPQYITLMRCANAKESSEVVSILQTNGIECHTDNATSLVISVREEDKSTATLALAASGFVSDEYNAKDYINTSMSATASDKQKLWNAGLQKKMEIDFAALTNVKSASVSLNIPEQRGTLAAGAQEASAFIKLELDGTFTSANAQALAKAAATMLGNETTSKITILDQDSNLLFAGGNEYSVAGIANSMQELKSQAERMLESQLKRVMIGTNQFYSIEVGSHLDVNYAEYEKTIKEYYANEGREQGMYADQTTFESENNSEVAGVPGTTSNDGTVYVSPDGSNTSSSQTESQIHFLPNEMIEHSKSPAGYINYAQSSMSIALIRYKDIYEEDIKNQGLLAGTTWEDYKFANDVDTKLEVDQDLYQMAANATGIAVDKITIVAYEKPLFHNREKLNLEWNTILSIVMLVVILGLLAFVILRSMRSAQEIPEEEELSVEKLLQSTPESELEDIDVETKSETRKMIEKFVDENPEAAAALLRNWLDADWA